MILKIMFKFEVTNSVPYLLKELHNSTFKRSGAMYFFFLREYRSKEISAFLELAKILDQICLKTIGCNYDFQNYVLLNTDHTLLNP
jgi:hypothetical protein